MRIVSFIAAGVIGLFSLGLIAGGGVLLWGDAQKDDSGFLSTSTQRFATNGHALATDNLDIDTDGADFFLDRDSYGEIRIQASSRAGKPVFVGVARTSDVASYLRGTNHDLVTDVSYSPFHADYREVRGDARPTRPAGEHFWAASARGPGTQAVTWDVEDGDWSVVVMNADASREVDVAVKAGAEVPFLGALGWGTLIGGVVMLVISATIAVVGSRARRPRAAAA
jgi:hypothetical protein